MSNNPININKTKNHLSLWLTENTQKKTTAYDAGNLGPGLGHKYEGVNPVNWIPTLFLRVRK